MEGERWWGIGSELVVSVDEHEDWRGTSEGGRGNELRMTDAYKLPRYDCFDRGDLSSVEDGSFWAVNGERSAVTR